MRELKPFVRKTIIEVREHVRRFKDGNETTNKFEDYSFTIRDDGGLTGCGGIKSKDELLSKIREEFR